ncbi:MAG: glucosylceramidase, partial [Bacteroides oleiciplenus]|nr:glucosylceramidase [Bacteroides oleiciplenus]
MRKVSYLFIYVFLFSLLVNGSACGSDNDETNPPKTPDGENPEPPVGLQAYMLTTTDTRTYDLKESTVEFESQASMSPKNILLSPQQTYQTMQGFGAALTGSSAFCLKLMKQEDRTAFLKKTYSQTEGYGSSYVRIAIGCSDFSLREYTCCDTPGIENFALTSEETDYVIPTLKEIIAINPNIRILASPWTCPLWMKDYQKYPVYQN